MINNSPTKRYVKLKTQTVETKTVPFKSTIAQYVTNIAKMQ